jgi:hypothetical protein
VRMAILYILMIGTADGGHPALEGNTASHSKESAHATD